MLRQRLLTALVLAPLAVGGIIALPTPYLAIIFSAVVLVGAWEWSRLAGLQSPLVRGLYVAFLAYLLWLCWIQLATVAVIEAVLYLALAWWVMAFVWILNHSFGSDPGFRFKTLKIVAGALVLIPSWFALLLLHGGTVVLRGADDGPYWVLFIVVLSWVADSGAYFAGQRWGRHKLAPGVSPGKTWEGVYGALFLVLIYALGAGYALGISNGKLLSFVLLSVVLVPVSVVGDLFESMSKRHVGLKDSSALLPGHGGVLDRVDSLTATAPLFVLGLLWLKVPA